jgi:hypothetical protein
METFEAPECHGVGESRVVPPKKRELRHPPRHQWFDAWKVAKGEDLKGLVEVAVHFVQHHEKHTNARTRARRRLDENHHVRQTFEATLLRGKSANSRLLRCKMRSWNDALPAASKTYNTLHDHRWTRAGPGCRESARCEARRAEVDASSDVGGRVNQGECRPACCKCASNCQRGTACGSQHVARDCAERSWHRHGSRRPVACDHRVERDRAGLRGGTGLAPRLRKIRHATRLTLLLIPRA